MKAAYTETTAYTEPRTTRQPTHRPERADAFAKGLLAAAIFTLGLAACGEPTDDVTGTVPADPAIEETQPVEPVTPTQ